MTEAEILLSITQGLIGLLVGMLGFVLKGARDDARAHASGLTTLRERVVRVEAQIVGIDRLGQKIDQLHDDIRDVRERVASWAGPRVS